jgi:hypothetical protein
MKNFTLSTCEDLIQKYLSFEGGEATQIEEGVLGLGKVILHGAKNKKTILITEFFINAWSSGHKIRMYNKTPKKYLEIINNI